MSYDPVLFLYTTPEAFPSFSSASGPVSLRRIPGKILLLFRQKEGAFKFALFSDFGVFLNPGLRGAPAGGLTDFEVGSGKEGGKNDQGAEPHGNNGKDGH